MIKAILFGAIFCVGLTKYANFQSKVEQCGYGAEEHEINNNFYILTVGRILVKGQKQGKPLLLLHDTAMSMDSWVMHADSEQHSLALQLAKMGYDVWLANGPGTNDYSRHEFLMRNEPAFWEYSPLSKATDFTQTLMFMKKHLGTDDDILIVAYGNAAIEVIYRYAENSYLL